MNSLAVPKPPEWTCLSTQVLSELGTEIFIVDRRGIPTIIHTCSQVSHKRIHRA
jgi:hypothetical protein